MEGFYLCHVGVSSPSSPYVYMYDSSSWSNICPERSIYPEENPNKVLNDTHDHLIKL